MNSSFNSFMRRILLITTRKMAVSLGVFLVSFLLVLLLVLWNVTSNISAGTNRYLEEIGQRLVNNVVNSVAGSSLALTAASSSHGPLTTVDADLQRVVDTLALETLIVIDLEGRGRSLTGVEYDFSANETVMQATRGKVVVFDCLNIHKLDGTSQKKSHLAMAVPSYDGNEIIGAVVADVGERWGNNFLNTVLMDGNFAFTVFDADGHLLIKSIDFAKEGRNEDLVNILNLFDDWHKELLEKNIKDLRADPYLPFLHINYSANKQVHRAVLLPIREYDIYLLTISAGAFGIKEFSAIDRTITVTLAILIITLICLCVTLASFYNYSRMLAFTDPVTGGMTKVRFELEMTERLRRALPEQYHFITININKFKLYNDTYGRSEGDRLLRIFYTRLRSEFLSSDALLCRSGVDEFDLLVANTPLDNILKAIDRAVNATKVKLASTKNAGLRYSFSVRVGLRNVKITTSDYVNIKDLAGLAMERADRTFSNNVRYGLFDEEDIQHARREHNIETSMQQSLDNEDFYILLQPKVLLQNGKPCGAEALIRWHHPQLGPIYPNEFIPVFERNGFITKLDMWVFTKVCELMQSWMKKGFQLVPISVNLSRLDIEQKTNLADELAAIADSYGVPREFLDLEVTETVFYKDTAFILKTVDTLRDKGFQCSLDDFGSGYSSLNMLPELRVDTIKIDKGFFASQDLSNERDRVVIKKVIELALELGMTVVAEGIETVAQKNFLCECACTVGQGYLFSKPIPPDEYESKTFNAN